MDDQVVHNAMLRPESYPSEEGPIHFIETHVSRLYFTPRHVYKIKKPVDFGFLNFSTLDRRRFYCEEEVRLNRRFAPDTYLGVVDIRRRGGTVRVGGEGKAVEYAVMMNLLPADRMLDRRLAQSDPGLPSAMDGLGRRLAGLHRESEICRQDGGQANIEIVRYNWQENIAQTRPFAGMTLKAELLELVAAHGEEFLIGYAPLLREREEQGWVRDGHGDLHAEHICLTEPLRIYDCIEFNRRFRVADVAADIAFLLMDLEFRGRRDLAGRLLAAYREEFGECGELESVLPFYKLYRAWVRGKVESFLTADTGADAQIRREAGIRARRYFTMAAGYLCPPALVQIGGLMGTGKSSLARALAGMIGAEIFSSDAVRKELAGELAASGAGAPFAGGIYSPDFTRRTYDLLLHRTHQALEKGRPVIVDASFSRREDRETFAREARIRGIPSVLVLTKCDRETALQRLDRRREKGGDPSDGRRELYDLQAAVFDEADAGSIQVDTSQELDYTVHSAVLEIIRRIGTRR